MNGQFSSKEFRISRTELARAGTLQYLRTFWFFLVGIPISGVLLLLFLKSPVGFAAGTLCLLWPISIPGRILTVSWKKSSKLNRPTVADVSKSEIILRTPDGATGTRIPRDWVKKVWVFGDLFVIEGRQLNFVLIRKSAFTAGEQDQFLQRIQSWCQIPSQANSEPLAGSNSGSKA